MSKRKPPPGARHALTDAEKRNPKGWFHPSVRAGIIRPTSSTDARCAQCRTPLLADLSNLGGTNALGFPVCLVCAQTMDDLR